VGQYEVTFDEWDACVKGGGCRSAKIEADLSGYKPPDADRVRGRRPVVNVSWDDAQAYLAWLSKETKKTYRLLSEAEWEYVARARSTTPYWWGNAIGRDRANCSHCGSDWDNKSTAPVGSFAANSFELYDTAGNVSEWVQDCWNESYEGAPKDGTAWISGNCGRRVVRGGSWYTGPVRLRSAFRDWAEPDYRLSAIGFRVARTLRGKRELAF
jgi:formylglycine-generating enzyme required for sulfatase activity